MEAYRIPQFGIDALERVTLQTPQPAPGEVLLRIHAVSLNYRDLMMVEGLYNPRLALPRIPCSDAAAEVLAIGDDVTTVSPGDRVCPLFFPNWQSGPATHQTTQSALGGELDGVLATHILLPASAVIPFPAHLTYAEAATLPCAALTAWNALHHAGSPISPAHPGDTILLQGTGGVSLFALQFAILAGLTPYGISSSDDKLTRATTLGLKATCNYRQTPEWSKWIAELTQRQGVDRIIEVGGANTLPHSLKSIRPNGLIAQIGVLSGGAASTDIPLGLILHKQIRLQGIYVGSRAMFAEMNQAIAEAQLHPVIDAVYPFDRAPEALKAMKSATHFGKIVIA